MPEGSVAVEGVATVSSGTESVVGSVEAVGSVFDGLPRTLFSGCGIG